MDPIPGPLVAVVRVLLVDDHVLVRAGIRSLLARDAGIVVVGEAGSGVEALELVGSLLPDVVVMDISMPRSGGLETLATITRDHPAVKVVILSMHDGEEYVLEALRAGAAGYLVKDSGIEELALAIATVARGGSYLTRQVAGHVLAAYAPHGVARGGHGDRLTDRQREIVRHVAAGRSNREIAHLLGLSTKTVESHRAELMERLGIHDVVGLVRYAIRSGLADVDE